MRFCVLAAALCVLLAIVPAGAPAAQTLRGIFTVQFPKGHEASNAPCPADVFCSVGRLAGYGPATITIFDDSFEEIDGSPCLAVTRSEQIDLIDGSGSLVLASTGTFCPPGGSGDSSAGPSAYGHPGKWRFDWVVVDGTGVFAGATGSGTETMRTAGGIGVTRLSGTLDGK